VIDAIDQRLSAWIKETLDVDIVSLAPPGAQEDDSGVSLYLLELADAPPLRTTRRSPLQLTLRYLVTTWAKEITEAHRLLGELALATMEQTDFELDLAPLPAETWTALGLVPQPAFILRVPLRRERPERPTPYVRERLDVRAGPSRSFAGRLLGPEEIPIADATVEVPSLGARTRTDGQGRFVFAHVPVDPPIRHLLVRAKGRLLNVTLGTEITEEEPLVIHMDTLMEREE
jgi:hypothetical protein